MKRISIVAFAAFVSGSAFAADMPVYRKAPVAPVASWTGWYAGLNVGYGFNDPTANFVPNDPVSVVLVTLNAPPAPPASYNIQGVLGGGQIGYNWQVAPNWLIGVEADFQGTDVKGGGSAFRIDGIAIASAQQQLEWFGTARARAGFLATDRLLVFGTGGFAYGSLQNSAQFAAVPGNGFALNVGNVFGANCPASGVACYIGSERKIQTGYAVGGGFEYVLWQNVTIKAEYLYVNLGTSSVTSVATDRIGAALPSSFNAKFSDFDFHVGRVGVNWRF